MYLFTLIVVMGLMIAVRGRVLVADDAYYYSKPAPQCLYACRNWFISSALLRPRFPCPPNGIIRRSSGPAIITVLLLIGGVKLNPEPQSNQLYCGLLNVRSGVHKAALIHDVIT